MSTNYNLIIRTWLPHPPSIKVMIFLLGSETIISLQTWFELFWAALKRGKITITEDYLQFAAA